MSPRVTGLLRGLVEAVASAVILAVAAWLEVADLPASMIAFVPVLVALLRTLEAEILDQPRGGSGAAGGAPGPRKDALYKRGQ